MSGIAGICNFGGVPVRQEEIRKMIDRVHEDFREDVVNKYTDVSLKMKSLFNALPPEIVEPTAGI